MPIYLCNPGGGEKEPWRHGIHVYATPFNIDATDRASTAQGGVRDLFAGVPNVDEDQDKESSTSVNQLVGRLFTEEFSSVRIHESSDGNNQTDSELIHSQHSCIPIRRVRHAEVVLIDDVCIAYSRYWLRLRWPGNKGGFAGYIAMSHVSINEKEGKIFEVLFLVINVWDLI